ncbi:MAG TPA: triose-phosphate isomerase [Candidatus Paceibacterota bacterium]|nr:triose-phosphate isomerase [Candidatus Paceibacterota bacterium]
MLIVANWKCNPKSLAEAKKLFNSVAKGVKNIKKAEVVICPPFLYIASLGSGLKLGAQDCFCCGGPFTGEISPLMLKSIGVKYVILGHSERREILKETDEIVNRKLKAVLRAGLKPILCVSSKSKNQKQEFKEIKKQLERALSGINKNEVKNLVVVYEPVWAISTTKGGKIATPKQAEQGAAFIRENLLKLFGKNLSQKLRILYGGSVNSRNIQEFVAADGINGALIGAASLNAKDFIESVRKS